MLQIFSPIPILFISNIGPIPIPEFIVNNNPGRLLSDIIFAMGIIAGLWAFINLLIAGFQFITSSGNPDSISAAWKRIYMSLIGLILIVGSFALAAIVSQIIFGKPTAIFDPFGQLRGIK